MGLEEALGNDRREILEIVYISGYLALYVSGSGGYADSVSIFQTRWYIVFKVVPVLYPRAQL